MIQEKLVTKDEIIELLKRSSDRSHPYYYRFTYSIPQKAFMAKRIKKGEIASVKIRREFHATELDELHPMSKAFETLEKNKSKIQGLVYAG